MLPPGGGGGAGGVRACAGGARAATLCPGAKGMTEGRAPKRDAATDDDRVAEVVEGWRQRGDAAERGDPEELIREHADIAAPLRRALDAMKLLDRTFPRAAARVAPPLDGQA